MELDGDIFKNSIFVLDCMFKRCYMEEMEVSRASASDAALTYYAHGLGPMSFY